MHNLADVAATLGGKSKSLIQILEWLNLPVDSALSVLDEFRKSSLFGPEFTAPVVRLLNNVGFKWGNNFDGGLDKAFTNIDNAVEAFKLVPVMWDNLPPPSQSGQPRPCSKGRAQLPGDMDVLLNGQRVVICNR
jgi:phospholipid/cholesterol/gamma-HCH transport system substrate-binding protein